MLCNKNRVYYFAEHEEIPQELVEYFKNNLCQNFKDRFYTHFNEKDRLSYFIGAQWLETGNEYAPFIPFIVRPKIEHIDFMKMFLTCLKHPEISKNFHNIYHIDFDAPLIPHSQKDSLPELDPLMVAHFLFLLKALLKKGIKKNFIQQEENLSSKIKGKLLFNTNLKANTMRGRDDRMYCRFSEFDPNCLENRILKKALRICELNVSHQHKELIQVFSQCRSHFEGVSDQVLYQQLLHFKINPLYKGYKPALKIAVQIIRQQRLKNFLHQEEVPPYCIDMPLLFEKYVYALMLQNYDDWGEIRYQISTDAGIPDFLLPKYRVIADTKYKHYLNTARLNIDDIRQLAGYGRYIKIRETLGYTDNEDCCTPCLIIYPDKNASDFSFCLGEEDKSYRKFYRLGVRLPILDSNPQPE